jgi:hypothetical protein
MKTAGIALAAGLAAAAAEAQTMNWPKPERTSFRQAASEVVITRIGGYPVVDITVNGRPFRFALETGGAFFGVSARLAKELGLTVTPAPAESMGPRATTTVDSVQIGGAVLFNQRAVVTEMFDARGWDGIVSPPLLRDVLYTLDLRNNRLRLERGALPAVDQRTVLAISRTDRGNRIAFPIQLGNDTVHPVLDTQALLDLVIADSIEHVLGLVAPPVSIGQASGPSQGTFTLRGARVSDRAFVGAIAIDSLPVIFRNRPGPLVGVAFLEEFVVTVDDVNGRIRFVPHHTPVRFATASWERQGDRVARAAQQGSRGRYMLGLRTSGTPSTVIAVEAGSNIENAGIRVGDVLLEVGKTPVERMTPEDWQRVLTDGTPVPLTLARDGARYETRVSPILRQP